MDDNKKNRLRLPKEDVLWAARVLAEKGPAGTVFSAKDGVDAGAYQITEAERGRGAAIVTLRMNTPQGVALAYLADGSGEPIIFKDGVKASAWAYMNMKWGHLFEGQVLSATSVRPLFIIGRDETPLLAPGEPE